MPLAAYVAVSLKAKKVKSSSHSSPSKHAHLPRGPSEATPPLPLPQPPKPPQPTKEHPPKKTLHIPPPPQDPSLGISSKTQSSKGGAKPSQPGQGRTKATRKEVREEVPVQKGYKEPASMEEEGTEGDSFACRLVYASCSALQHPVHASCSALQHPVHASCSALQWTHSNPATLGTSHSVLIRGVVSFQG